MKQTIVINLYDGVNSAILVPAYFDKEKNKTLILDNRYHVHIDTLPLNVVRLSATLDRRNKPSIILNWDWSESAPNQVEIPFQKLAKEMLMNHPNMVVKGHENKNLKEPLFIMSIIEDIEDYDVDMFNLRLKVMNILSNLNHEKRKDIAFYFGLNPVGWSDKKLLLMLAGANGILLVEKNAKEFLRIMSSIENKEVILSAVVKKAIILGKIANRNGKFYSYGDDQLIGVSEDDVVKYYFSNDKMYDFLVKEIGMSDFAADKIVMPKAEVKTELSEKQLRSEASSLGIKGFYNMELDKLIEAIANKKAELSKVSE